jgi:uncharacterized damage-inducible protein DinB
MFNHIKRIPNESFHKEVPNVFPTISTAFAHIYFTHTIWIKVMCGEKRQETIEFKNRGFLTLEFKEKAVSEMELLYKELKKIIDSLFSEAEGFQSAYENRTSVVWACFNLLLIMVPIIEAT